MKPSEIHKLIAIVEANWSTPDRPLKFPEAKVMLWVRMLSDLDGTAVAAAMDSLFATSKFPPTIAEIREMAAGFSHGQIRDGGEAWGDVGRAIRKIGRYRDPEFDDEITARCVRALGWVNLCDSENSVADRARFIELYDQLAAKKRKGELVDALPSVRRFRELESGAQPLGALIKLLPNAQ